MKYTPDNWVVLKLKPYESDLGFYKILSGWSGGYLDGDSWRLNSGITQAKQDGDFYEFHGSSGSCYRCHKDSYGLRMNNAEVYDSLKQQEQFEGQITLMPEDTDWLQVEW